ncbi:MAG: class I SAM-dependent methyltransferase [Rubricoccaceae bacterium]|nr:class I SAM-dependent methyltransferase [Rubricoccaceae bacterium]
MEASSFRVFSGWLGFISKCQKRRLGDWASTLDGFTRLQLADDEEHAERAINGIREELAASEESIRMVDFGAGTRRGVFSSESKPDERHIAEIYRRAAASPAWGRFLFRLVRSLKPERVLELGTNLGVSALHISVALELNQKGRLVTIEGDPSLSEIASSNLSRLPGDSRATVLTGRFQDVLPTCLEQQGPFDLVFIDGHHEEEATLLYFERIKPYLTQGACVVFDDIEPFRPVRRAWKKIAFGQSSSGYVDFLGIGLWFAPLSSSKQESDVKVLEVVQ